MSDPKIKFVAVELLKKGSNSAASVEYGLFKGIKMRSDGDSDKPKITSFLLIEKAVEADNIQGFNLNVFNILSISNRCDDTKELIIYKASVTDQKAAVRKLEDFFDRLVKDERMVKNDPEMIDVKSYANIPAEIEKQTPVYPIKNAYGSSGSNNNISDWQKKKEAREKEEERQEALRKIPTVFKRKGEPPGIKSLNLMKKKILAISAGEYESGVLPVEEEDDELKQKKAGSLAG